MSRQIVIKMPDDKITMSFVKGINKRLSLMEGMVKDAKSKKKQQDVDTLRTKKKKNLEEIAGLKKQLKDVMSIQDGLSARGVNGIEKSVKSIEVALRSLGSIRIPSPS